MGSNAGVLAGSPGFASGAVGRSMAFDGVNDSVRIPASPALNVGAGSGFTVEGWIHPTELSHLRPIVEWNSGSIGVHFWVGVDTAAPGDGERNLFANLIDTSGTAHQIRTPRHLVSTGAWQHVALTYDKATGEAVLYHNGAAASRANLGSFTPLTTGDFNFGNRPSGPFSGILWQGGMDEISLYRQALSAAEIQAIHNAGAAGKCAPPPQPPTNCPVPAGLVAWWPLEGNAEDLTGRHDGLIIGGPGFSSGKVGQALQFDGLNDLVRVPASPGLNVGAGGGFTIEGWINPADLSHLRPIVEWNRGSIGVHFWTGVDTPSGTGSRSLFANLIDTASVSHQVRTRADLLSTSVWQHVALTYDKASGAAAIYYNGALAAHANVGSFTPLTTGDLYLGNRPSGPFSGIYWAGGMDEISLYDRALSTEQILTVYQAGAAGKCSTNLPPPPANHAPEAKAIVGPLFELWEDESIRLVLAGNGVDAELTFDGSMSSDADGDTLEYVWTEQGQATPFAAGALATNSFGLGTHTLVLVVDDGQATDADAVEVEVISLSEAVDELILFVTELELTRKEKRQLLATLNRVWDSFEDGHLRSGIKQLGAFQHKVRAHLLKVKPAAGRKLIAAADQLIDAAAAAMDDDGKPKHPRDDKK
jgi:hypothetical protein